MTKDLHHEIEMIVAIGKGGSDIPVEKALDHVFGYGVGDIDLDGDLDGLGAAAAEVHLAVPGPLAEPLGMVDSSFVPTEAMESRRATGYDLGASGKCRNGRVVPFSFSQ